MSTAFPIFTTRTQNIPSSIIMRFTFQSALVSSFLLASTSLATPLNLAALAPRGDGTLVGCYSSSDSFTNSTTYTYQSQGWCQDYCNGYDAGAFALTNGDGCSCGNELPPSSDKVDTSKCSTKCDGWPSAKCMIESWSITYKQSMLII